MKRFFANTWFIHIKVVLTIFLLGLLVLIICPATISYLDVHSNGISALSYLVVAIVAFIGLDLWKTKKMGKWPIDIARQYLKAVLQLRDALKFVRNPFISVGEMQSALEKSGFDPQDYEDKKKMNRAVYSMRWNRVQEVWTNFEAILVDAETLSGPDAVGIQNELDNLVRKLRSAIWFFINHPENVKANDENYKLIYGTYNKDDEFSIAVDNEVKKIRIFLEGYFA